MTHTPQPQPPPIFPPFSSEEKARWKRSETKPMKIRQRNNGQWCMEHNGVEAPYVVTRGYPIRSFTVIALGDDAEESHVIADGATKEEAEKAALEHFKAAP